MAWANSSRRLKMARCRFSGPSENAPGIQSAFDLIESVAESSDIEPQFHNDKRKRLGRSAAGRIVAGCACAVFLSACGGDTDKKQKQAVETLVSWKNSIQLAENQWQHHQVPDLYIRQLIRAARKALTKQRRANFSVSEPSSNDAALHNAFKEFESRIQQLDHEVEKAGSVSQQ
jgi:hypothetical protein